ncbi:MAG TPA: hypothetical protein PKE55_00155 [Kiritimatiellia bacterium]|nr:hypothetical protein [Kiritimatiellia bacterium]
MNKPTNLILPDLQSAILCDDVRQERNGKFILIGLFDAIVIPQLPVRYPRLFLVTRWCSGEGEFRQQSRILQSDMSSVLVQGQVIPIRLPSPEATATNVEVFMNVEIKEQGTHWVEILLDGDLKLRYPLRVSIAQKQGQGGNLPPMDLG